MAGREPVQKVLDLELVAVGGKSHLFDAAFYRYGGSVQGQACSLRILQKIKELAAGRVFVLVAGNDDAGIFGRCKLTGILHTGTAGEHTGAGEEDDRVTAG